METTEQNKLIAEFMGARIKKAGYFYDSLTFPTGWNTCRPENMQYHTSWDWIMSVVEKIEGAELSGIANNTPHVRIVLGGCMVIFPNKERLPITSSPGNKLQATYSCVIQFIQWYNENKLT